MMAQPFAESVLVVEDEAIIAMMNKAWLTRMGFSDIRIESDLGSAMSSLATGAFGLALVDMNLGGESSVPLIDALRDNGIPTLLATGYSEHELEDGAQGVPCIQKPLSFGLLRKAVSNLLD